MTYLKRSNPNDSRFYNVYSESDELIAELKLVRIGLISDKFGGSDGYLQVTRLDDDATAEEIEQWLLPTYYQDCTTAGGYFCHSVYATHEKYSKNRFTVVIQHRYDI